MCNFNITFLKQNICNFQIKKLQSLKVKHIYLLTAIEVIDDLENNLSASLNFLLRLSALLLVFLLLAKYLSQPLIIFPYNCVSSK